MRKKILLLLTLLCMLVFGAITAYATNGFDEEENKICDGANLLTDSEEEELQALAVSAAKELKLDIIIITANDTYGVEPATYAKEFYDKNDFGYEYAGGSGIMLVIDIANREVYIGTVGLAKICIDDDEIEEILDKITGYASSEQYATLCKRFISVIKPYITEETNNSSNEDWLNDWYNGVYDTDAKFDKFINEHFKQTVFTYLKNPLICAIIALVAAGITVAIMSTSRKTKSTVNSATYMDRSSFNLRVRTDNFTHTTTTKTKINTETSSSGGSRSSGGGARSSSGRHGGGGRKF